jgi:glycosyltransferase involved in cell wall biosynthesis
MSILYLLTGPPPVFEGTDAVLQEVDALCQAFGGKILYLNPLSTSTRRFPKQLLGLHKIGAIRQLERECRINHVYFPAPYPLPILRVLRSPVLYTATASLDAQKIPPARTRLKKLERIIVSSDRDAGVLDRWGLTNYAIIPPAVGTSRIVPTTVPPGREFILLMASAPWTGRQFELKGIDLLLATAARLPFLRLVLLWRGVLADELLRRVQRLDIESRVEIVNRKVDVNEHLGRAHAAVLLARDGRIVRSFPHSLMESLVAGKPVLLTNAIAMSDYVSKHRCGVVVREMSVEALSSAIDILRRDYAELAGNALRIGPGSFSIQAMLDNYRRVYGL